MAPACNTSDAISDILNSVNSEMSNMIMAAADSSDSIAALHRLSSLDIYDIIERLLSSGNYDLGLHVHTHNNRR